ncbi:hypothetical protein Pelo_4049 [Pelomyxa schiedti]|nr:hypothetical protein Pelo_4049 [Pelomyxa schiedti]
MKVHKDSGACVCGKPNRMTEHVAEMKSNMELKIPPCDKAPVVDITLNIIFAGMSGTGQTSHSKILQSNAVVDKLKPGRLFDPVKHKYDRGPQNVTDLLAPTSKRVPIQDSTKAPTVAFSAFTGHNIPHRILDIDVPALRVAMQYAQVIPVMAKAEVYSPVQTEVMKEKIWEKN